MRRIPKAKTAVALLFFVGACGIGASASPAQEESDNAVIQMVVELLGNPERDMRAVGLQYVREEVPGEAATKQFAGLLPKLPPDAQAALLEALGDRSDPAARPAILQMLKGREEAVRAAALKALGALGESSDVVLLAGKAAAGSELEKAAARQSLVRLRGDEVNAAILSTMAEGKPTVRVALLGVLAARNAKEALPKVLKNTEDPEPSVRLAAIEALRFLADEKDTEAMVFILKAARDDIERRKAELALLTVCSRGRQACTPAVVAGLGHADGPSRIALLHALARAGGQKALAEVVARLKDEDEAVRDEAVRMLSVWRDPAAAPHLLAIAKAGNSLRRQVLAIRGLIRLAGPQEDKPADLEMLAKAVNLAKRPQEKRLILGILGGISTLQSLELVNAVSDDPALAEEAGLAAVLIAERLENGGKDKIRDAMETVLRRAKSQPIRDRARKVLESL